MKRHLLEKLVRSDREGENSLVYLLIRLWQGVVDPRTQKLLGQVDEKCKGQSWFLPFLTRGECEKYLEKEETGVFVVRMGRGREYLALSVKSEDECDHYKVVRTDKVWRMVGCNKEFLSISSMVLHLSILKEVLPAPLKRTNN